MLRWRFNIDWYGIRWYGTYFDCTVSTQIILLLLLWSIESAQQTAQAVSCTMYICYYRHDTRTVAHTTKSHHGTSVDITNINIESNSSFNIIGIFHYYYYYRFYWVYTKNVQKSCELATDIKICGTNCVCVCMCQPNLLEIQTAQSLCESEYKNGGKSRTTWIPKLRSYLSCESAAASTTTNHSIILFRMARRFSRSRPTRCDGKWTWC